MHHRRRSVLTAPRASALLLGLVATVTAPAALADVGLCPPGKYSSTGSEPCDPAPPGTFTDSFGAKAPIQAPAGFYQPNSGHTSALAVPAGYYQPNVGQSSYIAAPAGSFVSASASTAYQSCPAGSYSYGSASACRRVTTGVVGSNIVGPAFNSDRGTGGTFMGLVGNTITFDLFNATTDTASPSNLTDLSIISFDLGGANAANFSLVPIVDPVLSKGEHTSLALQWTGGAGQAFSVSVTFHTDQDACFAGLPGECPANRSTDGQDFVFNFSGRSAPASTVPEPGTWAIAALGLGLAAVRRRRPAGALPA